MIASGPRNDIFPSRSDVTLLDGDMVELSLLVPGWQAEALATAADRRGMTAAQVLRGLIHEFCNRPRHQEASLGSEPFDSWSGGESEALIP